MEKLVFQIEVVTEHIGISFGKVLLRGVFSRDRVIGVGKPRLPNHNQVLFENSGHNSLSQGNLVFLFSTFPPLKCPTM